MKKAGRRIAAFCLAMIMAFALSVVVIDPIDAGAAMSPYTLRGSGDFSKQNGGVAKEEHGSFTGITGIDNGDWVCYSGMNFSSGAKKFIVRYTKGTSSSATTVCLKVRVDSPTGKIIASVNLSTKTGKTWETKEATVNEYGQTLLGSHDVYLTFVVGKGVQEHIGDSTPRLDVGKFQFTKKTGGVVDKNMNTPSITSTAFKEWDQYGEPQHLMKWTSVSGATAYEVAAARDAKVTVDYAKAQFSGTSTTLYMTQGSTWYVSVRVYKPSGSMTVYCKSSYSVQVTNKTGRAVG